MSDYVGVILEDVNHKFDAILEGLQALAPVPGRLDSLETRMGHVESDVVVIKEVLKDHSKDLAEIKDGLRNHGERITRLERSV